MFLYSITVTTYFDNFSVYININGGYSNYFDWYFCFSFCFSITFQASINFIFSTYSYIANTFPAPIFTAKF